MPPAPVLISPCQFRSRTWYKIACSIWLQHSHVWIALHSATRGFFSQRSFARRSRARVLHSQELDRMVHYCLICKLQQDLWTAPGIKGRLIPILWSTHYGSEFGNSLLQESNHLWIPALFSLEARLSATAPSHYQSDLKVGRFSSTGRNQHSTWNAGCLSHLTWKSAFIHYCECDRQGILEYVLPDLYRQTNIKSHRGDV